MQLANNNSGYAFTRNPIRTTGDCPELPRVATARYFVSVAGHTVFQGRTALPLDVDIAQIVDASIDYWPEVPADNGEPLYVVATPQAMQAAAQVEFWLATDDGDESDRLTFIALKGGFEKSYLRQCATDGSDSFAKRFLGPSASSLFITPVASGQRFVINETELTPLPFMAKDFDAMEVREHRTGRTIEFATPTDGSLCALDVAALRYQFFDEFNVLSSDFDVVVNGVCRARISIQSEQPSADFCRVRFRNSFGFMSLVTLTGPMTEKYECDDGDFMCHDGIVGDFTRHNHRRAVTRSFTVKSGFKDADGQTALLDMLTSDHVWLLDNQGDTPLKVLPSADDIEIARGQRQPWQCTLKFEVADDDTSIVRHTDKRVFADEFTAEFN